MCVCVCVWRESIGEGKLEGEKGGIGNGEEWGIFFTVENFLSLMVSLKKGSILKKIERCKGVCKKGVGDVKKEGKGEGGRRRAESDLAMQCIFRYSFVVEREPQVLRLRKGRGG